MVENKVLKLETDLGGQKLTVETGKLALLASGAVTMQYGDTVVLATAVVSAKEREGIDFFPLTIDFEERWYATGKISGSRFIKREGRASELGILRARLTDRPIRPLFPKGYKNDVQVVITVLSADEINDPGILGINAASAALSISGAPFEGPVGAVRVGLIDGKFITNPTTEEREASILDLIIAGTKEAILMVEAGAKEVDEKTMLKALDYGHKAMQTSIELQEKLKKEVGKEVKTAELKENSEIFSALDKFLINKLGQAVRHQDKYARQDAIDSLESEILEEFGEEYDKEEIVATFDKIIKAEIRRAILEEEARPDGRGLKDVRQVDCEVDLSPRAHGSGLFTRGQTQILSVATLAAPSKAQFVESMDQDFQRRFMHYYNFPPFSTGEAKPMRSPGRREIGHGALAERAIAQVLPEQTEFPYTIRVVSETLSCNGSSSMGSVCGTTLALMAAGVPLKEPVAGIAMGLISKDGDIKQGYKILSDIQGAEDFAGDMDFKVAGTKNGITALQMDIKVKGLTLTVLEEAMEQAKEGRAYIMSKMLEAIKEPREELSQYAPRLTTLKINPDKIRVVIGKGGEMINKIIEETGVEIDIEDDGTVIIASTNGEAAQKAIKWIESLTEEPTIGKVYDAKVVKIMDFGAFVEFMPGKEGLVHISRLAEHRVENVADEVKEGEMIKVKLLEIDTQGRAVLSKKDAK